MSHIAFLMVNIWLEYEPDLTKRTENPSFFWSRDIIFNWSYYIYILFKILFKVYGQYWCRGRKICSGFIQKSVMTLTTDLQFDSKSMHIINQLIFY